MTKPGEATHILAKPFNEAVGLLIQELNGFIEFDRRIFSVRDNPEDETFGEHGSMQTKSKHLCRESQLSRFEQDDVGDST